MRAALVVLAALVAAAPAHASPPAAVTLAASPTQVRAGDVVNVQGDACPAGTPVTGVAMQTMPAWFPKGTPPFVPIDQSAINLVEDDDGVWFQIVAAEARTSLLFQVACSDGSTVSTTAPVYVFPPYGEFWWTFNSYGEFVATPGFVFFFGMRTMDCLPGAGASASLTPPGAAAPSVTIDGTVAADGVVGFDIDLTADLPAGTYTGTITCTTPQGDVLSNDVPVTVQGEFPASGGTMSLAVLVVAALLVIVGAGLTVAGRSRLSV